MSDKKSLFYDPENRFLWVQDGDKRIPLYTLANLNHETTRLTDDGYLQVKDSLTGMWDTVKDPAGNVLSLKGKDGVDGKDGIDGTNAETYVIDFSNDSDQIYIDQNNNLYENQSVTTEVKMFDGTTVLVPDTGYRLDIQQDSSLDGVLSTFELTTSNSYRVTFNFAGVDSIPVGMNSVNFTINIKNPLGDEIILSKIYKVSVVKDSTDYYLIPSTTRVRIKQDGSLDIPYIYFTVKKKSLGSNNQQSGIIEDLSSEGLVLKYTIGNSPSTASTTLSTARMSTIIPSNVNKELPISAIIELHKGSELRDFVIIDYLKDGEKGEKGENGDPGSDGAPSKQLVCTSGNEHTFYLNPQGQPLERSQGWRPIFALLEGSTQTTVSIDFSSDCVEPTGSIELEPDGIYITREGSYVEKTYVITVTYTDAKASYNCTLYANCVKGAMSYDLKCSPGYIKKSAIGVYTPIEFSVFSECSGGDIVKK